MRIFFENFEFLRPHFLWLFPVIIALWVAFKKFGFYKSSWEKVCEPLLLKYLLVKEKGGVSKRSFLLGLIGLLFAVFALSGPSFEKTKMPVLHFSNPLYFVLELTDEMNQKDIRPSRLVRAKIEISDILKRSDAAPVGLIVYADEPFVVSPLTDDTNIVENLLSEIRTDIMPIDGVRTDRAIKLAVERLRSAGYAFGNILLLTSENGKDMDLVENEIKKAVQNNIKVSVYGLSKQNENFYRSIAKIGQGAFADAFQNNGEDIVKFLKSNHQKKLEESQNETEERKDNGYWFVFISAFCLLYFFRRGFFIVVLFFLMTGSVEAGFLYNNDQEAFKLFNEKKFEEAASKFKEDDWKASAYYRAGDYQKASEILKDKKDIESIYNKGNALAKSGSFDEAIKAYENVLEQNPEHEDAKFNLEYIKQMKNKQQQKNQDNKEKEQKKQNENEQSAQNDPQEKNENTDSQSSGQNDENEDQNESNEQNDSQSMSGKEESKNESEDQEKEENSQEQNLENDSSLEKQRQQEMQAKEKQADQYDEQVQAREQKFREIKDDPGGLLRAFIKQEYLKNRYGK